MSLPNTPPQILVESGEPISDYQISYRLGNHLSKWNLSLTYRNKTNL